MNISILLPDYALAKNLRNPAGATISIEYTPPGASSPVPASVALDLEQPPFPGVYAFGLGTAYLQARRYVAAKYSLCMSRSLIVDYLKKQPGTDSVEILQVPDRATRRQYCSRRQGPDRQQAGRAAGSRRHVRGRQGAAVNIMRRTARLLFLLLTLAGVSGCGAIFNTATCSKPLRKIPSLATVSVFVVPFEADSPSPVVAKAALESARLIKVESIKANAEGNYSSITLLSRASREQRCDAQGIMDVIYDAQHQDPPTLENDAVVVWGIVVKREDALFSRMYSKILWQDEQERTLKVKVETSSTRTLEFSGQFPELIVAFPEKSIGTSANDEFIVDEESFGIPRQEPRMNATAAELPSRFTIGKRDDGWIALNSEDGKVVWLNATPVRATNGQRLFPETEYFFAAAAFAKGRSIDNDVNATRNRLGKLLNEYTQQFGDGADLDARTLLASVNLMLAFHESATGRRPADEMSGPARANILAAAKLLPDNPEIANLAALASLADCCSGHDIPANAAVVQGYFDRALQGDPANIGLLRNLDKWYSLVDQRAIAPQGMTRDQLLARHAEVRDRLWGAR